MKYNIIYADPPWKFQTYSERGSQLKSADCHYSCMNIDDIKNLPVNEIAAEDSVLFLWVTFPLLKEGLEVMEAWGFNYKTCAFNWVKRNKKADSFFMGLGYWTRSNSEICLLGTKGHPKRVSKSVAQICTNDNKLIKVFASAKDASEELNIDKGSITKCCQHKRKTAGGYIWEYYSNYIK